MSENSKLPPSRVALAAVVVGAAIIRLVYGLHEDGIYWPDEIYQSLEPAHRLVYGYGLRAWEFIDGARSWAFPGFVAGVLWIARAVGADRPDAYLPFVRCVFVAIAALSTWGVHRLARVSGASEVGALSGAAVWAFAAPFVYFGHRAMSETASGLLVVWGLAVLLRWVPGRAAKGSGALPASGRPTVDAGDRTAAAASDRDTARGSAAAASSASGASPTTPAAGEPARAHGPAGVVASVQAVLQRVKTVDGDRLGDLIFGASLLGLAVLFRLQTAVFCLGALGILAARKDRRALVIVFATLVVWAFLFGLLDRLTWGDWFHSAFKYLQFNLVEKKAEGWGTAPFGWYVDVLFRAMPVVLVVLVLAVAFSAPRATGLLVTCAAFFVLHAYTPHKELRFLLPMMPVFCALAGVGVTVAGERIKPELAMFGAFALVLTSFVSGMRAGTLTMGQLGAYEHERPQSSAWGDFADVNKLLLAASRQPDVCGLKVEAVHQAWTGGSTYLHQPAPYYAHNGPPRQSGHFNYVITWAQRAGGGQLIAQEGPVALVRIRPDCVPDPSFDWRLP